MNKRCIILLVQDFEQIWQTICGHASSFRFCLDPDEANFESIAKNILCFRQCFLAILHFYKAQGLTINGHLIESFFGGLTSLEDFCVKCL